MPRASPCVCGCECLRERGEFVRVSEFVSEFVVREFVREFVRVARVGE